MSAFNVNTTCHQIMRFKITVTAVYILGMLFYVLGLLGICLETNSKIIDYDTLLTPDILNYAVNEVGATNLWQGLIDIAPWDPYVIGASILSLWLLFSPDFLRRRLRISLIFFSTILLLPIWVFGAWGTIDFFVICFVDNIHFDGEFLGEGGLCLIGYFLFFISLILTLISEVKKGE